jgi:hypothetical protein
MFPGVLRVGVLADGSVRILLSTERWTELALWTLFGLRALTAGARRAESV